MALSVRHARFVAEYLVDGNGKQAAIRAGYSRKTAEAQASRLLRNAKVAAAVKAGQQKVTAKLEITAERIARELELLAFSNMLDFITPQADGYAAIDLSKLTRDQAAAIGQYTVDEYMDGGGEDARPVKSVKFKLTDKRASLMDLAKLLGFVKEKHEHTIDWLALVKAAQ